MSTRLSLHLMVKNGAATVERALRPLVGIIDEVCFIDTGSTDGTGYEILRFGREHGLSVEGIAMSPETHPDDYFFDETASYNRFEMVGMCSGVPLLADWSKARNQALDLCSGKYIMKLDADDEAMDPKNILRMLDYLDTRSEIDVIMSAYETMGRINPPTPEFTSMYSRIWRNRPEIRFREVMHENIDHRRNPDGSNWLMIPTGLLFRDWRDSPGAGVRPPNRNLKVLLREYERCEREGIRPSKHVLLYLAQECIDVASPCPAFALELLRQVEDASEQDRVWMSFIEGASLARQNRMEDAIAAYEKSAFLGSRRAALQAIFCKIIVDGQAHADELKEFVAAGQQKFYPFGPSNYEWRVAETLLRLNHPMARQSLIEFATT